MRMCGKILQRLAVAEETVAFTPAGFNASSVDTMRKSSHPPGTASSLNAPVAPRVSAPPAIAFADF